MLRIVASLLFAIPLVLPLAGAAFGEEKPPASPQADEYPELVTKKGEIFRKVTVLRVDPDALLVRHEGGMARVSLFDLGPEVRARYDFDPVEALKRYQADLAVQREQRQTAVLEAEKRRAAAIRVEAAREQFEVAKVEWAPVEAEVLAIREEGALLRASRIVLVPTQVRSTLGFLNPGPPKRVLEPFSGRPVLLLDRPAALKRGDQWKGYLNPLAERFVIDPGTGLPTIPAHRGASAAP
jgi:hypothetical protein